MERRPPVSHAGPQPQQVQERPLRHEPEPDRRHHQMVDVPVQGFLLHDTGDERAVHRSEQSGPGLCHDRPQHGVQEADQYQQVGNKQPVDV